MFFLTAAAVATVSARRSLVRRYRSWSTDLLRTWQIGNRDRVAVVLGADVAEVETGVGGDRPFDHDTNLQAALERELAANPADKPPRPFALRRPSSRRGTAIFVVRY